MTEEQTYQLKIELLRIAAGSSNGVFVNPLNNYRELMKEFGFERPTMSGNQEIKIEI